MPTVMCVLTACRSSLVNKPTAKKLALKQTKNQLKFGQMISNKILEVLEEHLRATGNLYIVGDLFSVADITLTCCLDFAVNLAALPYNATQFPALEAYRLRVSERKSVQKFPMPYTGLKWAGVVKATKLYHMALRG
jgi:glutathione S-transferase